MRPPDGSRAVNPRRVLVVIPAYNEAASLPSLVREFSSFPNDLDVLVIDDGSTDHTRAAVSSSFAARVRLISLPCNLGVGGAVQTGLKFALKKGYEIAVQVDGDGQHPPAEIPKLVEFMDRTGSDMVIGSRFLGDAGYRSTAVRRLAIRFFSFTLSRICRQRITDATSGFRAWNRRAMELLVTEYPEDYPEVEAVLILHRAGLRIGEVAVRMAARISGRSTIGCRQGAIFLVKIPLAILMNLTRQPKKPMKPN